MTAEREAPLRRWLAIGVWAMAAIVLALPVYLVRRDLRGTGSQDLEGAPTYVGRDVCTPCHERETEAWQGSDHDRAMEVATDSTVLGDFNDVTVEFHGVTSRFYRRDGKFYVHTEGPDGVMGEFEIAYTFGFDPLQQYLVPFPGGRLQALSIAWDVQGQRWFHLYPNQRIPASDWLHWTRNGQNWNGMCAECHSTNLVKGYDAATQTFSTTWFEIDVSCEACHGPGSRHAEWGKLPPMARPPVENYGLAVRTGDISSSEQVELCAPCHSRRAEFGDYDHARTVLLDQLLPSTLDSGLYYADGQVRDEVYEYGSFLQSKMYRNDVRCGDCHDAHSLKLRQEGNALCLQCHQADAYDTPDHHFHKKVYQGKPSDGALCVKCHMVERPYMVIDWRADHSLRVPRPDLSVTLGIPNGCTQGGCHADSTDAWAAGYFRRWYGEARRSHYGTTLAAGRAGRTDAGPALVTLAGDVLYPGIVRATAIALLAGYPGDSTTALLRRALDDDDPLIRYTALTSVGAPTPQAYARLVAPLLFDPVRLVRLEAAARLAGSPPDLLKPYQQEALAANLADYEAAMTASLDFAHAGHNLGNLYARLGDAPRAERYYRLALRVDDLFVPAKVNLAILLNGQGRNDEAERLLRDVVEAYPDQHDAAYLLALLLAETGRVPDAVPFLERAAAGDPTRSRVQYNLGLALQTTGRLREAEAALRRALELEPSNPDYVLALGDHYLRRGETRRALALAERLLATEPANAVGIQLRAAAQRLLEQE
jgi:predicted CXXCH cytochrome family protein